MIQTSIVSIPSDREAELCVVAAMLVSEGCIPDVRVTLTAGDFYDHRAKAIFEAICALADAGKPCDLVTLRPLLTDRDNFDHCGGQGYIDALQDVPSSAAVQHYAGQVKAASMLRQIMALGQQMQQEAMTPGADPETALGMMESGLNFLRGSGQIGQSIDLGEAVESVLQRCRDITEHGQQPGLMTGLSALDRVTGGFEAGELITLAGDTGSGKTALADTIARNAALAGKRVLLVSCEMNSRERGKRLLQAQSGVPGNFIRMPKSLQAQDWQALYEAASELAKLRLHIFARGMIRPCDIALEARRVASKAGGLDLVIVDYLQLLTPNEVIRNEASARTFGRMVWALKVLAMDMAVPVLMLSQLNRTGVKTGQAPNLHDLKESGDIENHSNAVLLLHHPADAGNSLAKTVWLRVAKSRDGMVTAWPPNKLSITLGWRPEITSFYDFPAMPGLGSQP